VRSTSPAPASAGKKRIAPKRIAQDHSTGFGDQRDERRLIDVAPSQVIAARQIVQLVNEISVMPAGIEMNQEFDRGQGGHDRRTASQPILLICSSRVQSKVSERVSLGPKARITAFTL